MIDISKNYHARCGDDAIIYNTDAGGDYPVHGATFHHGIWHTDTWTSTGRNNKDEPEGDDDLIEVKPRIKRTLILGLYADGSTECYSTRDDADKCAAGPRVACVKIEIDVPHGTGLDDE